MVNRTEENVIRHHRRRRHNHRHHRRRHRQHHKVDLVFHSLEGKMMVKDEKRWDVLVLDRLQ